MVSPSIRQFRKHRLLTASAPIVPLAPLLHKEDDCADLIDLDKFGGGRLFPLSPAEGDNAAGLVHWPRQIYDHPGETRSIDIELETTKRGDVLDDDIL